ncbi:dihydrofolate reductase [Ancylomarina sp. DW003]|nr:NAD(P)-dependent oxidoreductase [Ancylomarina sp. DW003]MDE5421624.1 dihydrofolate reductase [Ancylomarina sp. DW003]
MDNIKFKQIVIVDYTGLQEFALDKLQAISEQRIITYNDIPKDDAEIINRIQYADCVFVSWNTRINANVLSQCHNLKYIGMCCSLIDLESANVDVSYAMEKGIIVKGVRDYGDEGVGEFIITELIQLLKGLGKHQWREEPVELTNKKVGIIGIGTTGRLTACRLQAFGAKTFYYSRSRKPNAESEGIEYMPLNKLLYHCDIISFHLPRGTKILSAEHFKTFGNDKILINTSLGLCFEKEDFKEWISIKGNYAIFDSVAFGEHKAELIQYDNIIYSEATSGWTKEAKERLSYKVLENLNEYARSKEQEELCSSL